MKLGQLPIGTQMIFLKMVVKSKDVPVPSQEGRNGPEATPDCQPNLRKSHREFSNFTSGGSDLTHLAPQGLVCPKTQIASSSTNCLSLWAKWCPQGYSQSYRMQCVSVTGPGAANHGHYTDLQWAFLHVWVTQNVFGEVISGNASPKQV